MNIKKEDRNVIWKYKPHNTLTFLPSPRSRVLLEKMIDSQLVNKFPAFYGNRGFIAAFTTARHLPLS